MTSFIHPGKSPAAIVRRYSFLSGNVMFVMISDPCSVNSELYPTGLKLPSTFKRCISCNAACRRWAVNKYGCYTNKLSVHGQGSKTPDNTWNTNEDSTSTFTCMKTPFTHSYAKCPSLSLVLAWITPATVSVLLQICARQTTKAPTVNQHCPVSDLQVSLQYVDTFWNNFLNKNKPFLYHLTTKKKAPWFLEIWGNIQWHIVTSQKIRTFNTLAVRTSNLKKKCLHSFLVKMAWSSP